MKINITILFLSCFVFSQAQSSFPQKHSFAFHLSHPDTLLAIDIQNNEKKAIQLSFRFNGFFFQNNKEMIAFIKQQYGEVTPASILRFVNSQIIHQTSFNESPSSYNPMITANSLGLGLCSQKAVLMSNLCNEAGFYSRPVFLYRHVICFAEVNNRKELYDPDYNVILKNKKTGQILSLDSLKSFKFEDYSFPDSLDFKAYTTFYSEKYRNCYQKGNPTDNLFDSLEMNFKLNLPEKSHLTFPVSLPEDTFMENINYAFAKLTLPAGFAGSIFNPLTLYQIEGNCVVIIKSDTFQLPEQASLLSTSLRFVNANTSIRFEKTKKSISLYYCLNNRFLQFRKDNLLEIFLNDSNSVTPSLQPVKSKTELVSYRNFNHLMPVILQEVQRVKKEFPLMSKATFTTTDELVLLAQKTGLIPDTKYAFGTFDKKLHLLMKYSHYKPKEISYILQYTESFVAYTILINSLSNNEVATFSKYLKNSKKK